MTHSLDLFPIGNCASSALIDRAGRVVWACAPRVDGDPYLCNLLTGADPDDPEGRGYWAIDVENVAQVRQAYLRNTAVLRTEITDKDGARLEIIDFAPRYRQFHRVYRPMAFFRIVRPLAGTPHVRIRLRVTANWGERPCERTTGSNHIRFVGGESIVRLTTDAPISHVTTERVFRLEETITFHLGPDEGFDADLAATGERMLRETIDYWRGWVRTLSVPLEWQEAVIRAAITLKLCAYEETGAIVAALTTSIPEHAESGRNWDYRYCWLRDAYYVVQALNRLGAADLLENYFVYLRNLVDRQKGGHVQPVYGVGLEPALTERFAENLAGYRGMGPVRIGNQAHEHLQHDVYGQIILSTVQAFFDERLMRPGTLDDFRALEPVGERAFEMHDKPDASLWEFRGREAVHTYSVVMCWAACDRLANAAVRLGLNERAHHWQDRADIIREAIETRAWNKKLGRYAATLDGDGMDASLLQLVEVRYADPREPRMAATIAAVEKELRRGPYMLRYAVPDDFGEPVTAFNICTFWLIEALHLSGRTDEARQLFEEMLGRRTAAGLLSEDISFEGGELWGNYPQTYSLVGLINCASLISKPWSSVR